MKHLSAASRQHVFDVASSAVLQQDPLSVQLLRVLASTGPDSLADGLRDSIRAKASASVIAQLADEERAVLLDSVDVVRARDTLMARVKNEATEAAQGKVSFGGTDTRVLLGRAVAATSEASADAVALLMELATDPGAPGEHIMNARAALTTVRRAGKLTTAEHDVLHCADDPQGAFVEHGGISVAVLRARRLQVLALDLTADEAITVVGACRSEDPRVRQVALVTAGEAVGSSNEVVEREALAWAVVGGLFDPMDDVVRTAVVAVTAEFLARHEAAGAVALDRLPRLQQEGDVRLRAAVATVVRRLATDDPELAGDPRVAPTLAHAETDRSWIVRVAGRR